MGPISVQNQFKRGCFQSFFLVAHLAVASLSRKMIGLEPSVRRQFERGGSQFRCRNNQFCVLLETCFDFGSSTLFACSVFVWKLEIEMSFFEVDAWCHDME